MKRVVEVLLCAAALVSFVYAFLAVKSLEYWKYNEYATEQVNWDIKYYVTVGLIFVGGALVVRAMTRKSV